MEEKNGDYKRGWNEAFALIFKDACIDGDGTVTLDHGYNYYRKQCEPLPRYDHVRELT